MNQELSIEIVREREKAPEQSQRLLSKRCGVNLGSIHYCIKGYVKVKNFKHAQNKMVYACFLMLSGTNLRKELTLVVLKHKQAEYQTLQKEIKALEDDLAR
jgi:phage portal protein BeeE